MGFCGSGFGLSFGCSTGAMTDGLTDDISFYSAKLYTLWIVQSGENMLTSKAQLNAKRAGRAGLSGEFKLKTTRGARVIGDW